MESSLVIKVKYGDTLRRFSAPVKNNGQLDLNLAALRAKIISLFNFSANVEMILTYVDEDGDVVTLADDDDLLDVMKQHLKFLRIDVKLKNDNSGSFSTQSSGSSTPLRSSNVRNPFSQINKDVVVEVLKSVPEPLCETLSKLSTDLASKASSSSPVVSEILDCFSKMGQSYLNMVTRPHENGASGNHSPHAGTGEPNMAKDGGLLEVLRKTSSVDPNLKSSCKNEQVDLNVEPSCDPVVSSVSFDGDKKDSKEACNKRKNVSVQDASASSSVPLNTSQTPNTSGFSATSLNECPFSGIPVIGNSSATHPYLHPHVSPFKRSYTRDYWTSLGMFHKGIRCDGCGVLPITGPRFKSKVKEDYDLCNVCFSQMGNEKDYIRMDKPLSHRHPRHLKGLRPPAHEPWFGSPAPPFTQGGFPFKLGRPKLDSRFIFDVNVLDGTVMAPSTRFTKIWRMRNNGTVVWSQGTQLLWIGGDWFSSSTSVEVEIPAGGVPIDGELDVAVDFTAPELPGRYISYWRMASPSGAKFGQRVWVLIQVDNSLKESVVDSFHGLNLNAPPEPNSTKDFGITDAELQSSMNKRVRPVSDEQPEHEEPKSSTANSLLVDISDPAPAAPQTPTAPEATMPSSVAYPTIELTEPVLSVSRQEPLPPVEDVPISSEELNNEIEEALLKELEEMGFKQIDLNKEVLRQNEYNLEQSVDALCGVLDWDPILEELQEMGFCDQETNKRLLTKNNGSIKRVVMDLLTGEKA